MSFFEAETEAIIARLDQRDLIGLVRSIAKELSQIQSAHNDLLGRMVAIESMQAVFDRLYAQAATTVEAALPRSIQIRADEALPPSWGFWALEYEPEGTPFRWTGPSSVFSFDFSLDRSAPAAFTVEFGRMFDSSGVGELRCQVDGENVGASLFLTSHCHELRGIIPPRTHGGATTLAVTCPAMTSPAALLATDDHRSLGLSFRRLTVRHMDECMHTNGEVHSALELRG
jgi:hypothetical protein